MDTTTLEEVYEAVAPALRRFATSRLRDAEAAEDLVQEAFVRLTVERAASRGPDDPTAWLYRVVLNLIISSARHTEVVRRSASRQAFDDTDDGTPESLFLSIESDKVLRTALASADPDGRAGILLAARGYSGREIARIIGRSEAATRTLLCRTRGSIRRELAIAYAEVA